MSAPIGIIGAGAMGSAVAQRLVANGLQVLTSVEGRSAESISRARNAGMTVVASRDLCQASYVLSIVPPNAASDVATGLAPVLGATANPPIYVDCNAIQPQRAVSIGLVLEKAGVPFVDGSIIGGLPSTTYPGPTFYVSGPRAAELLELNRSKLVVKNLGSEVGAASAIKMCYGALTKGHIALGAAMFLAAKRAGVSEPLLAEMALTLNGFLDGYQRSIPDMFSKSQRWVPEMEEIAGFVGPERAEQQIFLALSRFYAQLAVDFAGDGNDISQLSAVVASIKKPS